MGKPKKQKRHTGRDYNMVGIINGANKAYVEKDQKKEANKRASRSKVDIDEEEGEEVYHISGSEMTYCRQCRFPFRIKQAKDEDELAAMSCGFCSSSCLDYFVSE